MVAELLGAAPDTFRKWEKSGELLPARKTRGGARYYAMSDLLVIERIITDGLLRPRVWTRPEGRPGVSARRARSLLRRKGLTA